LKSGDLDQLPASDNTYYVARGFALKTAFAPKSFLTDGAGLLFGR
jgi:hypothetical protein